jgi:hypothetical protein
MAREFQMREAGTGKLLGTLRTVDDCAPGAVVLAFKQDRVQVEAITHAMLEGEPQVAGGPPEHERPRGKARRR